VTEPLLEGRETFPRWDSTALEVLGQAAAAAAAAAATPSTAVRPPHCGPQGSQALLGDFYQLVEGPWSLSTSWPPGGLWGRARAFWRENGRNAPRFGPEISISQSKTFSEFLGLRPVNFDPSTSLRALAARSLRLQPRHVNETLHDLQAEAARVWPAGPAQSNSSKLALHKILDGDTTMALRAWCKVNEQIRMMLMTMRPPES
jgi:hypothetical protein